jgi:DNA-binding response OmpR family regulator
MRVLVVEDERRLAAAVKRGLEASGFAVDLAFDGVSARLDAAPAPRPVCAPSSASPHSAPPAGD